MQRNPGARFMGGAWVFPGGALDGSEDARDRRRQGGRGGGGGRAARPERARRVLALDHAGRGADPLRHAVPASLAAPDDAAPQPDGGETVDSRLVRAAGARSTPTGAASSRSSSRRSRRSSSWRRFGSAAELLEWADGRVVEPVEPRVIVEGEVARIVLPGRARLSRLSRSPSRSPGRPATSAARSCARCERSPRRRPRARHGAAAVRPGRARPEEDRVPAGRRARPRGRRRAGRRAPTCSSTSRSSSWAGARRRRASTSTARATCSRPPRRPACKRLVYTSSVAAYGFHADNPQPLTEDVPPRGTDASTTRRRRPSSRRSCSGGARRPTSTPTCSGRASSPGRDALMPIRQLRSRVAGPLRRRCRWSCRPRHPVPARAPRRRRVRAGRAVRGAGPPGTYNLAGTARLRSATSRVRSAGTRSPPRARWCRSRLQPPGCR